MATIPAAVAALQPAPSLPPRSPGVRAARCVSSIGVLALLTLAGCASAAEDDPFSRGAADGADPPDSLFVTVENQNFNDATLFALWEGRLRQRMGTVTGNSTRTFGMAYRAPALRFEVDFLAGGDFTGDQIEVGPGDHLELTLPPTR